MNEFLFAAPAVILAVGFGVVGLWLAGRERDRKHPQPDPRQLSFTPELKRQAVAHETVKP